MLSWENKKKKTNTWFPSDLLSRWTGGWRGGQRSKGDIKNKQTNKNQWMSNRRRTESEKFCAYSLAIQNWEMLAVLAVMSSGMSLNSCVLAASLCLLSQRDSTEQSCGVSCREIQLNYDISQKGKMSNWQMIAYVHTYTYTKSHIKNMHNDISKKY